MAEEVEKDEKTEEATPRRRQEARERGQVPFTAELVAACMLIFGLILAIFGGGNLAGAAGRLTVTSIEKVGWLGATEMSLPDTAALISSSARGILGPFTLLILPLLLVGVLVGYGQVGFSVSPKAVSFDLNRLNPIKGFGRMFSMRSAVRTGMALAKIILIALTTSIIAWTQVPRISAMAGADLGPTIAGMGFILFRCAVGSLIAVLLLGLIDLFFQRFQHEKELRMSKKEVREDMKNVEGDPHLKSRIRQIQRELANQRMMAEVPEATVVVTNPTHFAVALRYQNDDGARHAPICVAKGVDHVAQRIKDVARDAGVVCVENVALARALYAQVEVGQEIPEEYFEAVAEVLAYVYRIQGDKVPGRAEARA